MPHDLFNEWFAMASKVEPYDATAMSCSTIGLDGAPDCRTVLFKGWLDQSEGAALTFYTNYESAKAQQLAKDARIALTFHWPSIEKQVRITGSVSRLTEQQSDDYFASRPRASQIGAWASQQSRPLQNFETLRERVAALEAEFESTEDIPRPPHWGGFGVAPATFEFWCAGPGRVHERMLYKVCDSKWKMTLLQP